MRSSCSTLLATALGRAEAPSVEMIDRSRTLASGSLRALAISGALSSSIWRVAASPYLARASALSLMALASASPAARIVSASAWPRAAMASASARARAAVALASASARATVA